MVMALALHKCSNLKSFTARFRGALKELEKKRGLLTLYIAYSIVDSDKSANSTEAEIVTTWEAGSHDEIKKFIEEYLGQQEHSFKLFPIDLSASVAPRYYGRVKDKELLFVRHKINDPLRFWERSGGVQGPPPPHLHLVAVYMIESHQYCFCLWRAKIKELEDFFSLLLAPKVSVEKYYYVKPPEPIVDIPVAFFGEV